MEVVVLLAGLDGVQDCIEDGGRPASSEEFKG
jgi:hypothetical protein